MSETSSAEVAFPSGTDSIRGHLATPRSGPRAPAIVLIPDVHGLSDLYRGLAERFAERGTSTLVIDLYSREGTPRFQDMSEVMRWIAALPDPRVLGDVQAAVDWLATREGIDRGGVGVTGFCMGGQYALLAACTLRGIAACVSFYGMLRYAETNERKPRSPLEAAAGLSCPYLGIFGEEDALIPMADVADLRGRLQESGKTFDIRTYAGCGHAFLNHTRPDAFRPKAAADAFDRAAAFFERNLARGPR